MAADKDKDFYWILNILNGKSQGRADRVGCTDRVGHADCVRSGYGYLMRLHVGLINGDRINYNDKSGEIKPIGVIGNLVKQSFRMLVSQLAFFGWLSICFEYYFGSFNNHFKPINKALALKTVEIQSLENLCIFYLYPVCLVWFLFAPGKQARLLVCLVHLVCLTHAKIIHKKLTKMSPQILTKMIHQMQTKMIS
jgi:hypothetical protein